MNTTSQQAPALAWERRSDCDDFAQGHVHCVHGHLRDCPDPGTCEIVLSPYHPRLQA